MRKQSILTVLVVLATATVLCLQSGSAPAMQDNGKAKTNPCACCNHESPADTTKPVCSECCKAGKCPMMTGDATGAKCPMMEKSNKSTKANSGCCGDKCPMHGKNSTGHGCCCGDMA